MGYLQLAVVLRRLQKQASLCGCMAQHCFLVVLFSLILFHSSKTAILKLCTDLFHQCIVQIC